MFVVKLKNVLHYFSERFKQIITYDSTKSYYFLCITYFLSIIISIYTVMGTPTGIALHTRIFDSLIAIALNTVAFSVVTFLLSYIFSLIRIPIPRVATSAVLYVGILTTIILEKASSGLHFSIIIGLLAISTSICLSLIVYLLWPNRIGKITTTVITVLLFAGFTVQNILPISEWTVTKAIDDQPVLQRDYQPLFMTYGSGLDEQRKEFGSDVNIQTHTVDASHFITKWGDKRQKFWGFGPEDFPINGRVWMPEGDGPFPVVLMVHGNHTMEYLSTAGYDYLGELLASQGFFFVSVDEDFVNYSNMTGQPNDNYQLRAWFLLQHLMQLQTMTNDPDHVFYNKLDLNQIALGGHSRGGQAAAMAADYLTFFNDEEEIVEQMAQMNIAAVFALSPTDRLTDNKYARLHNTSYLTLHGSHDTDVYSFRGDFQFYRTDFDAGVDNHHFRSTVYIENANHVHFNTDWGSMDLSLPRGAILNRLDLIPATEQQQIAKVYISAFLQTVLQQKDEFLALFRQEEETQDWLPDTTIISKYRPASYRQLYAYNELPKADTYFANYENLTTEQPVNRSGKNYTKRSMLLSWKDHAFHKINFHTSELMNRANNPAESIVLTIANNSETNEPITMNITLMADGTEVDYFHQTLSPSIQIKSTILGLFDEVFRDGKYKQTSEPIFENINIPLTEIADDFDGQIEIQVEFTGTNGEILLEEIGLY